MGHPLQAWAAKFGFGRKTGVDVGPESAGLLPTPEWRKRAFTAKTDPSNWQIDRLWKPGDSIQLAIGQKDLLVTPLQMARFYAAIANNGKLVRPHLAMQVEEGGGTPNSPPRVVHNFPAAAPQSLGIDPYYLHAVQDGLWQATHSGVGTSTRSSATSRSRSPARPAPRRRTRAQTRRTSPGGAATGRRRAPRRRSSWSAR